MAEAGAAGEEGAGMWEAKWAIASTLWLAGAAGRRSRLPKDIRLKKIKQALLDTVPMSRLHAS